MNLKDIISSTFRIKLDEEGIEIIAEKSKRTFKALVTAGDLDAMFSIGDQALSESIQLTALREDAPSTGEILVIDNMRYMVQGVQKRPNGPVVRIYCNLR